MVFLLQLGGSSGRPFCALSVHSADRSVIEKIYNILIPATATGRPRRLCSWEYSKKSIMRTVDNLGGKAEEVHSERCEEVEENSRCLIIDRLVLFQHNSGFRNSPNIWDRQLAKWVGGKCFFWGRPRKCSIRVSEDFL